MYHARNNFLANSAFAANKHWNVDRSNLQNLLPDSHHLRARRQKTQIFRYLVAVVAQRLIFRRELFLLPGLQHRRVELGLLKRLRQVVMRAQPNRFHYHADFVRTRQHDHVQAAVNLQKFFQRLDAAHFRHQNIQNDDVRPVALIDLFDRLRSAAQRFNVETFDFQQCLQILPDAWFIIHHKDFFFYRHRHPSLSSRFDQSASYCSIGNKK